MNIFMIFFICGICQYFFPWWSLLLGTFLIGFWNSKNGFSAFKEGFLGVGFLWFFVATTKFFYGSEIIALRIQELLNLPCAQSLIMATTLIGALLGSLATLTAYQLRITLES